MMLSIFFNFQCLQRTLSKSTLKILAYVFSLCLMQYLYGELDGGIFFGGANTTIGGTILIRLI
jgi:hypothetical protein